MRVIPNNVFRGICRKITGQAKQFPTLGKRVVNHARSFLEPFLEPECSGRAHINLYKFEQKFMQAFKIESWKESNKKKSCLKEVRDEKIRAILAIAKDDRGRPDQVERIYYAEHELENLLHLVKGLLFKIKKTTKIDFIK